MGKQKQSTSVTEIQPGALSTPNSARYLGVSDETIRRMIRRGDLRAVRIGHRVVVPLAELDRILGKAS